MNTKTIPLYGVKTQPNRHLPTTARGRALYTVSWFLQGTAPRINHDQSHAQLKEIDHVYA